ncbi:MAG: twin-arginine translocation signal domain-containing protein [Gammaproteobacteria bacterium]|nr:twin-arginine translocation signal domain-containing protein [Gammaproteobacteria bacterium]
MGNRPFTPPPWSRRDFLKGTTAAMAVVLVRNRGVG